MNLFRKLLLGAAALPISLFARESNDSVPAGRERELELNEVVVVASRPVLKQSPDRIVYLTKNDPYALGLNGVQVLDRIPRVSVTNDQVSVAGKTSVKYIIDGHLLEMPDEARSTVEESPVFRNRENRTAHHTTGEVCRLHECGLHQHNHTQ